MPELMQNFSRFDASSGKASAAVGSAEDARLRTLRRLEQLAGEIQSALRCEDMDLVRQASGLLAPALAQWAEMSSPADRQNPVIAHLTREVQQQLQACEAALARAMSDVQTQQGQMRQHLKRVRHARSHRIMPSRPTGKTLNISP